MSQLFFWLTGFVEFLLWLMLLRYLFGSLAAIVAGTANNRDLWVRSLVSLLLFYGAFVACPLVRHSDAFRDTLTHVQPADKGDSKE